jgi:hypothetical protein
MSAQINSLLFKSAEIKEIQVLVEESVFLNAGQSEHFKIRAKGQPSPFRARVSIQKGWGYGFLSLSQGIERPTRDNCSKGYPMRSKELCVTYACDKGKGKTFGNDYIFMAVEADRELVLMIECGFRKGKRGGRVRSELQKAGRRPEPPERRGWPDPTEQRNLRDPTGTCNSTTSCSKRLRHTDSNSNSKSNTNTRTDADADRGPRRGGAGEDVGRLWVSTVASGV